MFVVEEKLSVSLIGDNPKSCVIARLCEDLSVANLLAGADW